MSLAHKNILLLFIVVILAVVPLLLNNNSDFAGADGLAEDLIGQVSPGYEPWFASFWEPPGGETESLLFALQAALGAGFLGYYIGMKKGQAKVSEK